LTCSGRNLSPGQHLFVGSDRQSHVYLVRSGVLCLYSVLRNGRRQIVSFRFPGDFIAPDPGATHRFSAQALTICEIRQFPLTAFRKAMSHDGALLTRLYDLVRKDLSAACDLVCVLGQHDAEASVAAFLLDLDARLAPSEGADDLILLPMLRIDIADHLGLTHETVSRVFTAFKRRGFIQLIRGRRVRLENRSALVALTGRTSDARDSPAHLSHP
jgi:CRP-like cAMP-binding protein